jgi:hypothetical protein
MQTKNPALIHEKRDLAVVHITLPGYRPVMGQEQIRELQEGTIIFSLDQLYKENFAGNTVTPDPYSL